MVSVTIYSSCTLFTQSPIDQEWSNEWWSSNESSDQSSNYYSILSTQKLYVIHPSIKLQCWEKLLLNVCCSKNLSFDLIDRSRVMIELCIDEYFLMNGWMNEYFCTIHVFIIREPLPFNEIVWQFYPNLKLNASMFESTLSSRKVWTKVRRIVDEDVGSIRWWMDHRT